MDQLVSTLKHGAADAISIADLANAFTSIDVNDTPTIRQVMSINAQLIHTLTVLMIKNCCDRESVLELLQLIKSIRRIRELDYTLFNNVDFVLALDRLVAIHGCVEEAVSLLPKTQHVDECCKSKIVHFFTTKPTEEVALGIARLADQLTLDEKSAVLQQAINCVDKTDSGMLFALICLIVKCKGMTESQCCELLVGFAKSDYASKYTNEIRDLLERLHRWSHGLGLESFEFVELCESIGSNLPESVAGECLLGCLEVAKNELLHSVDSNLYTKKLRMALRLNAPYPPPFKTIALLFTASSAESNHLAVVNEIQQVLLELAIIYHPDEFKQYQTVFAKTVSWTQSNETPEVPSTRRFSFINSTLDMFMNYSLLYEQCAKYKQVMDEAEKRNTQMMTVQSDFQQTHNDQIALIAELEKRLSARSHDVNCLRGEADDLSLQLQVAVEKCRELEDIGRLSEKTISELSENNQRLSRDVDEKSKQLVEMQSQQDYLKAALQQEQHNNGEERRKLATQFAEFKRRSMAEKATVSEELAVTNLKIKQSAEEVGQLRRHLDSLESMLKEYQSETHNLKCQLELRDEQLRQRKSDFVDIDKSVVDENMDNLSDLIDLISDRDDFVHV